MTIHTEPPGAKVFLNDAPIGETPLVVEVEYPRVRFVLRRDDDVVVDRTYGKSTPFSVVLAKEGYLTEKIIGLAPLGVQGFEDVTSGSWDDEEMTRTWVFGRRSMEHAWKDETGWRHAVAMMTHFSKPAYAVILEKARSQLCQICGEGYNATLFPVCGHLRCPECNRWTEQAHSARDHRQ
jgi:hypothetical protein